MANHKMANDDDYCRDIRIQNAELIHLNLCNLNNIIFGHSKLKSLRNATS